MVSIRGPRSALTDFIEEHNIKIVKEEKHEIKIEPITVQNTIKKRKTIKKTQPNEITNIDKKIEKLEDIALKCIFDNRAHFQMNDNQLDLYSKYLSRERKMCLEHFEYLVNNCKHKLCIYDCSMIKDEEFIIYKTFEVLELHYCGQLTEARINKILKNHKKLKKLVITGAYLLESFTPPKTIQYLDTTHCSRLGDKFITQINRKYKKLDTLILSYCYGLTENCRLKLKVKHLYICETNLSYLSIKGMKNIDMLESLSIKCCPNILATDNEDDFEVEKYKYLKLLDCEGISTLRSVVFSDKLLSLNLAYCYNIDIEALCDCKTLEHLNLSKVSISADKLMIITRLTNLKSLNISWTESLTDDILLKIITHCKNLEKVYVFGCFNLTTTIGELAWSKKNTVEIIGNPAETRYLLNN